jgi:hypothetical protein
MHTWEFYRVAKCIWQTNACGRQMCVADNMLSTCLLDEGLQVPGHDDVQCTWKGLHKVLAVV